MKEYLKDKLKECKNIFWDNYVSIAIITIISLAALIAINVFLMDWNAFIYHGLREVGIESGTLTYKFLSLFEYYIYCLSGILIVFNLIIIIKKKNTIFTKIINKEIPSDILFENQNIIVIKDINPQAKKHFLIIPKKEIQSIDHIEDDDKQIISEMFFVARDIARKLGVTQ